MIIDNKSPNTLLKRLNIDFPIVQAPMLGVTTPNMVAEIANSGGLGSLPVGGLSPEKTRMLIRETKARTKKPFAVNLFVYEIPELLNERELNVMQDFLELFCRENDLPFHRRVPKEFKFYNHKDQLEILMDEEVRIISFTFGALETETVSLFKNKHVFTIGTATTTDEAAVLEKLGIDAVVAQGIEAGGHRGSFLHQEMLPQIGLFSLVSQMVDSIDIPVIAAGGIYDQRTIRAALCLGAQAAQIGSFFLRADESAVGEAHKRLISQSNMVKTMITRALSGRWARGIPNKFIKTIENANIPIPDYTLQNALTAPIRAYAQKKGLTEYLSLWAGQSAHLAKSGPAKTLFLSLIEGFYE
ncbi:nitronate monooxygenase [bacterium A37T11]|nr:nitronate monooxygenase [bacterium A37T11]